MPSGLTGRQAVAAGLVGGAVAVGLAVLGATGIGAPLPTSAGPAGRAAPASPAAAASVTAAPAPTSAARSPTPAGGADDPQVPEPGPPTAPGSQIAQEVSNAAQARFGRRPDSVTCPDLVATVGAVVRCTAVAAPVTVGVTVTVTAVRDGRVFYDIRPDDLTS